MMLPKRKQQVKRKSAAVMEDPVDSQRARKRLRLETAGDMRDSARENTSPNPISRNSELLGKLRDARVLLDKNAVKYYFTTRILFAGNVEPHFVNRVKKEIDSNVEVNESVRKKKDKRPVQKNSQKQASLLNYFKIQNSNCAIDNVDQRAIPITNNNLIKEELPTFESNNFGSSSDQIICQNASRNETEQVDESRATLEHEDEMLMSVDEEFDDKDNITIFDEPTPFIPQSELDRSLFDVLAQNTDTNSNDISETSPNNQVEIERKEDTEFYYCNDCSYKCLKKYEISLHIRSTHSQGLGSSKRRPNRNYHNITYTDEDVAFHCDDCNKSIEGFFNFQPTGKNICPNCVKKELTYKCRTCDKPFKKYWISKNHVNKICRPNVETFKCNDCIFVTKSKKSLSLHIQRIHLKLKLVKKGRNNKGLGGSRLGKRERKNYSKIRYTDDDIAFYCDGCNVYIDGLDNFTPSLANSCPDCKKKLRYQCRKCKRFSAKYWSIKTHVKQTCKPDEFYKCRKCDHSVTNKHLLFLHFQEKHPKILSHKYEGLMEKVKGPAKEVKLKSFSDEKIELHCDTCNASAEKFYNVSRTKMCPDCDNKLHHKCRECKKLFPDFCTVKKHVQFSCQPDKFFKCSECDFVSTHRVQLPLHIERLHPKLPPQEYDKHIEKIVDSSANVKMKGLKKRNRRNFTGSFTDTDVELYCNDCSASVDGMNNFKSQDVNLCPNCGKKIEYRCRKCERSFSLYWTAKNHFRKACQPKDFHKCDLCNYVTARRDYFRIHFQKQHPELKPDHYGKHIKWIQGSEKEAKVKSFTDVKIELHCDECNASTDKFYNKSRTKICPKCDSKLQHRCRKCKKTFSDGWYLKEHVNKVCFPDEYFKCKQCDFTSKWKEHMPRHVQAVHAEKPVEGQEETSLKMDGGSAEDQYILMDVSDISKIDSSKINRGHVYNCDECSFQSYRKKDITVHISKEHMNHSMLCTECGQTFEKLRVFKEHKLFCGLVYFECKFCPKRWSTTGHALKYHLKTHTHEFGTKTLEDIYSEIRLQGHRQKANLIKSRNEENLKVGNDIDTIISEDMFKIYCANCKKTSDTVRGESKKGSILLKNCPHCKSKARFKCPKCDKTFSSVSIVKYHLETCCQPKNNFKCNYCDFVTTWKYSIENHTRKYHDKEHRDQDHHDTVTKKSEVESKGVSRGVTFYCDDCDYHAYLKNLIQLHILNEHLKNSRISYCRKCGQIFHKLRMLAEHESKCGAVIYKCKFCPKTWIDRRDSVKGHLKNLHAKEFEEGTITVEEVHQEIIDETLKRVKDTIGEIEEDEVYCDYCDYETRGRDKLNSHIMKKHAKKYKIKICLKCGKLYHNCLRLFEQHQIMCGLQHYKCKFCPKTWSNSCHIKRHLQLYHSEEIGPKNFDTVYKQLRSEAIEFRRNLLKSANLEIGGSKKTKTKC